MDHFIPDAGYITNGVSGRGWKIEIIAQSTEQSGWQVQMHRFWNRGGDGDLIVSDPNRAQPDCTARWDGLLALTRTGSSYETVVRADDCKAQLRVLWNDHWRFADRVRSQLRGYCRPPQPGG